MPKLRYAQHSYALPKLRFGKSCATKRSFGICALQFAEQIVLGLAKTKFLHKIVPTLNYRSYFQITKLRFF